MDIWLLKFCLKVQLMIQVPIGFRWDVCSISY